MSATGFTTSASSTSLPTGSSRCSGRWTRRSRAKQPKDFEEADRDHASEKLLPDSTDDDLDVVALPVPNVPEDAGKEKAEEEDPENSDERKQELDKSLHSLNVPDKPVPERVKAEGIPRTHATDTEGTQPGTSSTNLLSQPSVPAVHSARSVFNSCESLSDPLGFSQQQNS